MSWTASSVGGRGLGARYVATFTALPARSPDQRGHLKCSRPIRRTHSKRSGPLISDHAHQFIVSSLAVSFRHQACARACARAFAAPCSRPASVLDDLPDTPDLVSRFGAPVAADGAERKRQSLHPHTFTATAGNISRASPTSPPPSCHPPAWRHRRRRYLRMCRPPARQ